MNFGKLIEMELILLHTIGKIKETKKRTKKAAVVADLSNLVLDINTGKEKEEKEETKKPRKITKKAKKLIIEEDE